MNNLCIDVKNLNKHFGEHHVVKDFSLQVAKRRDLWFSRSER